MPITRTMLEFQTTQTDSKINFTANNRVTESVKGSIG